MGNNNIVENNSKFSTNDSEKSLFIVLICCITIGAIGLIGYALSIAGICWNIVSTINIYGRIFYWDLFGMLKRIDPINGDYSLNNSLVEISDWLTKIIVGLGLVNLKEIPSNLMSLGNYITNASGSSAKGQSLDIFAMCVVVYFSILGIYIGYNYMRLVLSQKYKLADDNILVERINNLESILDKEQKQKKVLIENINNFNIEDEKYLNDIL